MNLVFLAAGANAEAGAFDEFSGRVAYASGRNVVVVDKIGDVQNRRFQLLPDPPTGRVHSVQFVESQSHLLIGADDGNVRSYTQDDAQNWNLQATWVLPAAVMICREFEGLKLAITSKAHLYSLSSPSEEPKVIFSAGAGKKLTALVCGKLPDGSLLLAVGMSDCSIRLLTPEGRQLLSLTGHQNWTTSLQFLSLENSLMLLSASLDKTVRLWKISSSHDASKSNDSLLLRELVPQQNTFGAWKCEMDAVALGHENAVYFARFVQDSTGVLRILSGSADRSVILWKEGFAGSWVSELQLTEASDYTLLFVGGSLIEQGSCLVAVSSTGALMLWKRDPVSLEWTQSTPITGHTGVVEQCSWLPCSNSHPILLSCSADQTTRAFSIPSRLEISRPQIHGYDLKCLTVCEREEGAIEMISGADEKVLRVFAAPDQFYSRAQLNINVSAPAAAQLPALGLSNKLLNSTDEGYNSAFTPSTPFPLERELTKQSLWPEVDKLYAHNRELSCLAVNQIGTWMASAAKGTKASDAAVCLWKRIEGAWKLHETLELHNLTVTKMAFSSKNRLLITSRDRSISVLQFDETGVGVHMKGFEAHSRQIWAASWINATSFITGGREGLLKWWRFLQDDSIECTKQVQFESGVTALAVNENGIIAVGDERGVVQVSAAADDSFSNVITCADAITDLKWNADMLAVASADHSIRVLQ